jgi:hypothetical protein
MSIPRGVPSSSAPAFSLERSSGRAELAEVADDQVAPLGDSPMRRRDGQVTEETLTLLKPSDLAGAVIGRTSIWSTLVDGRRIHLVEVYGTVVTLRTAPEGSQLSLVNLRPGHLGDSRAEPPLVVLERGQKQPSYRVGAVVRCIGLLSDVRGPSLPPCYLDACWLETMPSDEERNARLDQAAVLIKALQLQSERQK